MFARVLVVDDDPGVLRILVRLFESWGSEALKAKSVPEGLELLAKGVNLVVTDIGLAEGSGVEIAQAAAAMHPAPPVIAITGLATVQDGLLLGRAGVSAVLQKPFDPESLYAAISSIEAPAARELDGFVRRTVGARPMPELLDGVRRSMVVEALARTDNNKTKAASLLGISRQNLQKILERSKT